jgi:glycosyltransferase involved in cell wall biosynthesis
MEMNKLISIIISASDNADTLTNVITSASGISPHEIIVLINENNNKDGEFTKVAEKLGCKVIVTQQTNSNDGCVQAAKEANGDVLLFLDGNIVLPASQLHKFVEPILKDEAEVVLNNFDRSFLDRRVKQWPDSYTVWKQVLNDALGHTELNIDSLLSMPHAITKKAIQAIGYESLVNPALAHMRTIEQGWRISRQYSIDAMSPGEFYSEEQCSYRSPLSDAEKQNMRNYLKALAEWLQTHGVRGGYTDGGRRRDIIEQIKKHKSFSSYQKESGGNPLIYEGWGVKTSIYNGKQLSVVIPAQNEEQTIEEVIEEARRMDPLEIIVVVNGSTDNTEKIAKQLGATVIVFKEALGHDVGRAIGAFAATGDIILFTDADFAIPAHDLHPFAKAVADGVDVALNDLSLHILPPLYVVDLYKYMLNLACNRKDLGIGSILAVPHAISRTCLDGIGWESLLNPCRANAKAVLEGYKVSCVHFVDVMKPNRIRPDQHFADKGHPKAVLRIIGDHLEAVSYVIEKLKADGKFHSEKTEKSFEQKKVSIWMKLRNYLHRLRTIWENKIKNV